MTSLRAKLIRYELILIMRSRVLTAALLLLAGLATTAVVSGSAEVQRQRDAIDRVQALQIEDLARVIRQNAAGGDPGNAAYYTFHATYDPLTPLAFAALGQRDIAPYVLRVRALGLEAQLYEGEQFNPESALSGRFDFAFVLVYLAPLFIIALFHDLRSGEREAGRWQLLRSLTRDAHSPWRARAWIRFTLALGALLLPLIVGAALNDVALSPLSITCGAAAIYLAFWSLVALAAGRLPGSSAVHAARLLGVWTILTLIAPTLAHVVINRAIPADRAVELTLAHREAVHGAWERPREEIMQRFATSHPHWREHIALSPGFEWKWYFAFHQLADESVAEQSEHFRLSQLARQRWSERVGWLLPSVAANGLLHRLAHTDLPAQLRYQLGIREFHSQLREFYYGYLFGKQPFVAADYAKAPMYAPMAKRDSIPFGLLAALALAVLASWASHRWLRNED